ncbi:MULTISPECIES: RNA polymerase sigma factor, partial [Pirellulaceae]
MLSRSMTTTPDRPPTDGELLTAVLSGQREKFAEIVRRYQTPLLRLAMSRLGRQQEAEDAVQQTFLNAFRWLNTYDSRYSFRTWLWTILINNCNRLHQKSA